MIGREIGSYRIIEKIGEGGMGVVYKGIDSGLDRLVAIKVLIPELAQNPELIDRFRSEAKAQANLHHTNIAALYAFLQLEGQCLIVMEFLEGETFEDLVLRQGKLPWKGAVSLTRQALQGLGFAHGMGIVHRDIKPSNLMLTSSGTVKVMDFGIAKALGSTKKTRTGLQMGTLHYMSPEQIRGRSVDARSDIYSLGVTLYQMLSGDLPFQADSDFDLMNAHINTPPPVLTNLHADVPKSIEDCVLKAMSKEARDRYQSADDFGASLEQASTSAAELPSTAAVSQGTFGKSPETIRPVARQTVVAPEVPQATIPPPLPIPKRKRGIAAFAIAASGMLAVALAATAWSIWHQPSRQEAKQKPPATLSPTNIAEGSAVGTKPATKDPISGAVQATSVKTKLNTGAEQLGTPPAPKAILHMQCNLDCAWSLDGQPKGLLTAGNSTSVPLDLGSHTISAATPDLNDQADAITINASSDGENFDELVDLKSKQTQRLQQEAADTIRQKELAKQLEIARQVEIDRQLRGDDANRSVVPGSPATSSSPASGCHLSTWPNVWRNVATNSLYRFRFDCEHIFVNELSSNRAAATLMRNKMDRTQEKYVGFTTTMSRCPGQGKMEVLGLSPNRIETRIEVPNVYNRCTEMLSTASTSWASVPVSFVPQNQ